MRPSVQVVLALAYLTLMFGAAVYFVVITHRLAQIAGGSVGFLVRRELQQRPDCRQRCVGDKLITSESISNLGRAAAFPPQGGRFGPSAEPDHSYPGWSGLSCAPAFHPYSHYRSN